MTQFTYVNKRNSVFKCYDTAGETLIIQSGDRIEWKCELLIHESHLIWISPRTCWIVDCSQDYVSAHEYKGRLYKYPEPVLFKDLTEITIENCTAHYEQILINFDLNFDIRKNIMHLCNRKHYNTFAITIKATGSVFKNIRPAYDYGFKPCLNAGYKYVQDLDFPKHLYVIADSEFLVMKVQNNTKTDVEILLVLPLLNKRPLTIPANSLRSVCNTYKLPKLYRTELIMPKHLAVWYDSKSFSIILRNKGDESPDVLIEPALESQSVKQVQIKNNCTTEIVKQVQIKNNCCSKVGISIQTDKWDQFCLLNPCSVIDYAGTVISIGFTFRNRVNILTLEESGFSITKVVNLDFDIANDPITNGYIITIDPGFSPETAFEKMFPGRSFETIDLNISNLWFHVSDEYQAIYRKVLKSVFSDISILDSSALHDNSYDLVDSMMKKIANRTVCFTAEPLPAKHPHHISLNTSGKWLQTLQKHMDDPTWLKSFYKYLQEKITNC